MELVVTLRKRYMLDKLAPLVDGIIVGKFFTTGFNYTLDEIKEINDYCKNHNLLNDLLWNRVKSLK